MPGMQRGHGREQLLAPRPNLCPPLYEEGQASVYIVPAALPVAQGRNAGALCGRRDSARQGQGRSLRMGQGQGSPQLQAGHWCRLGLLTSLQQFWEVGVTLPSLQIGRLRPLVSRFVSTDSVCLQQSWEPHVPFPSPWEEMTFELSLQR